MKVFDKHGISHDAEGLAIYCDAFTDPQTVEIDGISYDVDTDFLYDNFGVNYFHWNDHIEFSIDLDENKISLTESNINIRWRFRARNASYRLWGYQPCIGLYGEESYEEYDILTYNGNVPKFLTQNNKYGEDIIVFDIHNGYLSNFNFDINQLF